MKLARKGKSGGGGSGSFASSPGGVTAAFRSGSVCLNSLDGVF